MGSSGTEWCRQMCLQPCSAEANSMNHSSMISRGDNRVHEDQDSGKWRSTWELQPEHNREVGWFGLTLEQKWDKLPFFSRGTKEDNPWMDTGRHLDYNSKNNPDSNFFSYYISSSCIELIFYNRSINTALCQEFACFSALWIITTITDTLTICPT